MWYLLNALWLYLLGALVIGLAVGWITSRARQAGDADEIPSPLFWGLLAAIVVGALVAMFHLFRGSAGLWVDSLLMLAAAYLLGCCLGCLFKRWFAGETAELAPAMALAGAGAASSAGVVSAPAARLAAADVKPAPAPAPPVAAAPPPPARPGRRPVGLVSPRGGAPDDLSRLPGIDKPRIARLNGIGLYHYDQICALDGEERAWVFDYLGLAGTPGMGAKAADYAGWGNACALSGKVGPSFPAPAASTSPAPAPIPAAPTPAPVAAPVQPLTAAPAQPAAEPVPPPVATPATEMDKVENEDAYGGQRPYGLKAARGGAPDDLRRIRGIGPQNEARLHALGIWHFDQIAGWTSENVTWVGSYLAFPGRIEREQWVDQAKVLASGATTDFAERYARGEVASSVRKDGQDVVAEMVDGTFVADGARPANLLAARPAGNADDLKLINGVGRAIEDKLHALGVWTFAQVAEMSDAELAWVSASVGFPGRALREDWRGESKTLAAGGETEHSKAVKAGKIPSSLDAPPKK